MPRRELILGTAGHIDHGKTALVRALTGVDTDRLAQEKQRGISIEIGFAHLDLEHARLGIVDLPGHERFIRNMLAGASGVDIAMLVIAADDSIMPQTREHLEILKLLDIETGLIALSKSDLADADWLELVKDDIRQLVADSFLADAPIIETSATTGAGINDLRSMLDTLSERASRRSDSSLFQMAIDRSFVLKGLGTVVTGTVETGELSTGDEVELLPGQTLLRVRGLQTHGNTVESVHSGQRAAIHVAGVHHTQVQRGHVMATTGYLKPSRWVNVRLRMLKSSPLPLKHRARVRLHIGTQEIMARVSLFGQTQLDGGDETIAQLRCQEPVIARSGQPFVIRCESPLVTLGGGHVLAPSSSPVRRRDKPALAMMDHLDAQDRSLRVEAACYLRGLQSTNRLDLARETNIEPDEAASIAAQLVEAGRLHEVTLPGGGTLYLHPQREDLLVKRLLSVLKRLHAAAPMDLAISIEKICSAMRRVDPIVIEALVKRTAKTGRVRINDRGVLLPKFAPKLTDAQLAIRQQFVDTLLQGGVTPPTLDAMAPTLGAPAAKIHPVAELCVKQGDVVYLSDGLYMHCEIADNVRRKMCDALSTSDGMTISEIKDVLGVSRKYAVPICEFLDKSGVTRRVGDKRVLSPNAATASSNGNTA